MSDLYREHLVWVVSQKVKYAEFIRRQTEWEWVDDPLYRGRYSVASSSSCTDTLKSAWIRDQNPPLVFHRQCACSHLDTIYTS